MKIKTNFSVMRAAPLKMLGSTLSTLALGSLLLCVWLVVVANDLLSRSEELQTLQTRLDKRVAEIQEKSVDVMPDNREIADFRNKVALLNSLDQGTGLPVSLVMAKLESLLPGSAWLISFRYQRETGEVTLTAESKQTAPLSLFLHRIEKSGDFSQVLLVRQLQTGEGNNRRIQYSIKFTGRPQ